MNSWAPLALNANKTNKTIILSLGIFSIMARITFQTHYLVRWNPEEWPCLISIIKVLRFVNLRNFEQLLPSPVFHCWRIYTSALSQYSFTNNMSLFQIINPASTVTEIFNATDSSVLELVLTGLFICPDNLPHCVYMFRCLSPFQTQLHSPKNHVLTLSCLSAYPSTCISMGHTAWISMKFDIGDCYDKKSRNSKYG